MACQGASGAVRRRVTLDTEDAIQSRMEKEGVKGRIIFHSLLITFLLISTRYACLVVIPNPATERGGGDYLYDIAVFAYWHYSICRNRLQDTPMRISLN